MVRKGERRKYRFTQDAVHSLFSKEAVIITKIDQGLVIDCKAAETISHSEALKTHVRWLMLANAPSAWPKKTKNTHLRYSTLVKRPNSRSDISNT